MGQNNDNRWIGVKGLWESHVLFLQFSNKFEIPSEKKKNIKKAPFCWLIHPLILKDLLSVSPRSGLFSMQWGHKDKPLVLMKLLS